MFKGFTDKTYEYFMAIRANNNRTFFQDNHDWYVDEVRTPMRELAAEIGGQIGEMDARLETRPEKVVSRPNRDIRFSKDKSPYADYIWMAFRRPGEERKTTLGVYFDMSDGGASFGMGFYDENKPVMNALRRKLTTEPDVFTEVMAPAMEYFTLHAKSYKKIAVPDDLPDALKAWYPLRGFYVEREISDFKLLKSPDLTQYLLSGYRIAAPLYRYIVDLQPEEAIL